MAFRKFQEHHQSLGHGHLANLTTNRTNRLPLSPKLDSSASYGVPGSVLPRRSRGMDFSRACTNLHHSTLAEQSSPDSSPVIGGRAMNIPSRKSIHMGPWCPTFLTLLSPPLAPCGRQWQVWTKQARQARLVASPCWIQTLEATLPRQMK